MLVDQFGRLLSLKLSPGQDSDHIHAPYLAQQAAEFKAQTVVGDKGYDSSVLRNRIEASGMEAVIASRSNRKIKPKLNSTCYRQRNIVERFIGKIKENRRVATRYDKKAAHFEAFIILAAIKIWLNFIC